MGKADRALSSSRAQRSEQVFADAQVHARFDEGAHLAREEDGEGERGRIPTI